MSEKLPWFQFHSRDWYADQKLARVSAASRGIWVDLLASMHIEGQSEIIGTVEDLTRLARCTPIELGAFIADATRTNFCDVTECNGLVSIVSRRFVRDLKTRMQVKERVRRHRAAQSPDDAGNGEEIKIAPDLTGAPSISRSVSKSSSLSDLESWFQSDFTPAYPEHRQVQQKTALAWLKESKPDEHERARIMGVLALWAGSEDWEREKGAYVPGMGKFFRDGWHLRQPRGSPNGPSLSPGRQKLFESIQRSKAEESAHGNIGSEGNPAQVQRHLDPPADRRRDSG